MRVVLALLATSIAFSQTPDFVPANLFVDNLRVFTSRGASTMLSLPKSARGDLAANSDGNGRSIYLTSLDPSRYTGITKVDIKTRQASSVRGSDAVGRVDFLVESLDGKLCVSGFRMEGDQLERGMIEIDQKAGKSRMLQRGEYGAISPDCRSALRHDSGVTARDGDTRQRRTMSVVDTKTGESRLLAGAEEGEWSPNGRWLLTVTDRHFELRDAATLRKSKDLGLAETSAASWSPDSKQLLVIKNQITCVFTLYGRTLEVIDVETGKRKIVPNSHCEFLAGAILWVDREAMQ